VRLLPALPTRRLLRVVRRSGTHEADTAPARPRRDAAEQPTPGVVQVL